MSSITASTDMTQVKPEQLAEFVDKFFQDVEQTVNGNLDFKTNINCKLLSVTFSAANSSVATAHGLGRVPAGYIVTSATAALSVYNGSTGNDSTNIYLQASAPGTVGLIVF